MRIGITELNEGQDVKKKIKANNQNPLPKNSIPVELKYS